MPRLLLFYRLMVRPLFREPLRAALIVLAVALGVAVVVAIDLAGDAATGSFRSSIETLAGKTDLEILATGGIDERLMGRLVPLPFDAQCSPLVETQAVIEGAGAVPLYGVDMAGAPENTIVPSRALAGRLHLAPEAPLTAVIDGRPVHFQVRRIAEGGPAEFLAIDI